jgi:uncharacterized protein
MMTERSGPLQTAETDLVTSLDDLLSIYDGVVPTALLKEQDRIIPAYAGFIEVAPFLILATSGQEGLDCSPRGDAPGFVRIADEKTVMIPDRRGNNRVDSLRNIIANPHVALLFMIPGINNTMRINGRAVISRNLALRESFAVEGKPASTVIIVTVDAIYPQCVKALVRSKLWDIDSQIPRDRLPSIGDMMKSIAPDFDAIAYERDYPERMKRTLY